MIEETGLGAAVLGDPIDSVVWLVRHLARFGKGLSAGDMVLSGSLVRPVPALPGSSFEADFGGLGLLTIEFG